MDDLDMNRVVFFNKTGRDTICVDKRLTDQSLNIVIGNQSIRCVYNARSGTVLNSSVARCANKTADESVGGSVRQIHILHKASFADRTEERCICQVGDGLAIAIEGACEGVSK